MKTPLLAAVVLAATSAFAHPGHEHEIRSEGLEFAALLAPAATQKGGQQIPASTISVSMQGDSRFIRANGIPDHVTGQFPNRGNPNRISAQNYSFTVTAKPQIAARPTFAGMTLFGVALNGVVFDPSAAEWWNGDRAWQYEPLSGAINLGLDQSNAHVQPTGAYHYHGLPIALLQNRNGGQQKMTLIGWAADGFPMYGPLAPTDAKSASSPLKTMKSSWRLKAGNRTGGPSGKYDGSFVADYEYAAGTGDLDECNGRIGVTPEFLNGTYYYVLTSEFPFIPRYFKGTPNPSFSRRGPGGGGPPGGSTQDGKSGPGGPGFPPPKKGPPPGKQPSRKTDL
ncbi:MAG: YHYH protein [Pedosphaera sp.]|nr:YHYH protein [Pedosphaera sp.]